MPTVKVAISLEKELLGALDGLVQQRVFSNRSQAISAAVAEKLERLRSNL